MICRTPVQGSLSRKAILASTSRHFSLCPQKLPGQVDKRLLPFRVWSLSKTKAGSSCNIAGSFQWSFDHDGRLKNFSTSSTVKAVMVTLNPRTDENGNEMVVDITPRAALVSQAKPNHMFHTLIKILAFERDHV